MRSLDWRDVLLGVLSFGATLLVFALPPIPQDPAYHAFADQRGVLGIANFWNIVSNIPFAIVGIFGLVRSSRLRDVTLRPAYLAVCLGSLAVGFGSAYYHHAPSTPSLAWDRLPMTVAFMGLFTLILQDRVSERLGRRILWPLILVGVTSVIYWRSTELHGQGDLRAYALIQFLPMLLIPLILLFYKEKELRTAWLWLTVITYVLAKLAELYDVPLYNLTGALSGHSLKHILGAMAVLVALLAVRGNHTDAPVRKIAARLKRQTSIVHNAQIRHDKSD